MNFYLTTRASTFWCFQIILFSIICNSIFLAFFYVFIHFVGAFVDWVSILNQYCQKNRINQPKYSEATNALGGFGSSVVVTTERFFSDSYCRTKKEAKHSAARAALLGLNIAVCKFS